jgi:hypothetical protein
MRQHIDATDDEPVMRQAIAENQRIADRDEANRDEANRQAEAADMARIETLDYLIARDQAADLALLEVVVNTSEQLIALNLYLPFRHTWILLRIFRNLRFFPLC